MTGPRGIEPFRVAVPDDELHDLERRLRNTRWPPDLANDDWRYGANTDYLRGFVDDWLERYDWRAQEAAMNEWPHYRTVIDDVPIHFLHVRGRGPSPTPLLITHGWPWTFWDYAALLGPLTDPERFGGHREQAFDLVVPSLPGYVFSSPLPRAGIASGQTVHLWAELMTRLDYSRFGVHGGDIGAIISAGLAQRYPERVIGCHLMWPSVPPGDGPYPEDYGPDEQDWPAHNDAMAARAMGHVGPNATNGQTLAHAFNDSPVGLAAWLLVPRRTASGCDGDLARCYTLDQLATLVSLYWFTQTSGTSMRWYADGAAMPALTGEPIPDVPFGLAVFPGEVRKWPRAYIARRVDLRRWTVMPRGAHYAPAEHPELVIEDLRAFFDELRTGR